MEKEVKITVIGKGGTAANLYPVKDGISDVVMSDILEFIKSEVVSETTNRIIVKFTGVNLYVDTYIDLDVELCVQIINSNVVFENAFCHKFEHLYVMESRVRGSDSCVEVKSLAMVNVVGESPEVTVTGSGVTIKNCGGLKIEHFSQTQI